MNCKFENCTSTSDKMREVLLKSSKIPIFCLYADVRYEVKNAVFRGALQSPQRPSEIFVYTVAASLHHALFDAVLQQGTHFELLIE